MRTVHEHDGDAVLDGIALLARGAFDGAIFFAYRGPTGGTNEDVQEILVH